MSLIKHFNLHICSNQNNQIPDGSLMPTKHISIAFSIQSDFQGKQRTLYFRILFWKFFRHYSELSTSNLIKAHYLYWYLKISSQTYSLFCMFKMNFWVFSFIYLKNVKIDHATKLDILNPSYQTYLRTTPSPLSKKHTFSFICQKLTNKAWFELSILMPIIIICAITLHSTC